MRHGRSAVAGKRVAAAATVALTALTLTGIATDPAPAHVRITTDINFADDVRPILRRYCMPCHNPKGSAPDYIDLTTYGNDAKPGARAWAVAIEEELMTGRMPPWTADARYDHFRNSRRMSQQEIDIVVAWVQGGGPQGPRRNLPPPPEFTEEEWELGYPDLVLEPSAETVVEPGRQTASHREVLPVPLEEDAWITGYEFRPRNPGVVYRMAAWVHEPEDVEPEQLEVEVQVPYDPFRDEDEPEPTRMRTGRPGPHFLGQWLRGDDPVLLPDGAGKRLRTGSKVELVVEYRRRPNDDSRIEVRDRSSLGLFLNQTEDEVELWVESARAGGEVALKGRRAGRPQTASLTLTERARLTGLHPHVGDRLARMEVRVHFPDQRVQTVLYVPEYDPEFPASYLFEEAIHAPPGTRVELIGSFDIGRGKETIVQPFALHVDYELDDHLVLPEIFVPRDEPQTRGGMLAAGLGGTDLPAGGEGRGVPGIAPNPADPNAAAHMDHNPLHGGQFFMAANNYHHLEGALPRPGEFRLYIYDDFKQPVDPRNFGGDVVFEAWNEETERWDETRYPMAPLIGNQYLLSEIPEELPSEFFAHVWLAGEQQRYDFYFEETTVEPPAGASRGGGVIRAGPHSHERPPMTIPEDPLSIMALMALKRDRVRTQIETGEWLTLYVPAFDARDLAEVLLDRLTGLSARQRGRARQAIGRVMQSAAELDRSGDLADRARAQRAFERFDAGVRELDDLIEP
ncbi:MAG: hypothetical protein OYL92_08805 [Acidobacteriota bacterium]|nr:hypothetical protein [Acidobacteriota bacterium]MDE3265063.1 hypothetical protein [Acidobacteriota bacterium]